MQYSYVFSARNVDAKGHFGSEPGPVRFLKVPLAFRGGKLAAGWTPKHEIARDVAMTLEGRIDRDVIPTRAFDSHRGLVLREAARPPREAAWLSERDDDVRR